MAATRAGIVAVVGAANVGKSTLINALVGEKVAIVSPVAQTTRTIIRAIFTEPRGQLVFLDSPGVHKAKYDLGRMMNRMARSVAEGVDVVLLVLDASRAPREEDDGWMRRLMREEQDAHVVMLMNKCDTARNYTQDYRALWQRISEEKNQHGERSPWRAVAGLTGQGVPELTSYLFDVVPEGPNLFPDDILTDYPRKLNIADIIREKYIPYLKEELPHAIAIAIDDVEESENKWNVTGTLFVDKHSQKGIVLGAKGRLLKKVTDEARKELSDMYGVSIKLTLWVKVEKDWTRNFWMLKKLGYA
jgi:GTPase